MKLLELLVKELPKRGGWPEGAGSVAQSRIDGQLYFYAGQYNGRGADLKSDYRLKLCDECRSEVSVLPSVTREQYEAVLASSKQEWNGDGVPPVGTECEYSLNAGRTWFKCKIDYVLGTQGLIMLADVYEGGQFVGFEEYNGKLKFRHLRSEADKSRDAAIASIDVVLLMVRDRSKTSSEIYDAIASGKITGVKLED